MKILIIDFETTGLSHAEDEAIEVGAILYSPDEKKVYDVFNSFIIPPVQKIISRQIESIIGMDQKNVYKMGRPHTFVFGEIVRMSMMADKILAHNAKFDQGFFKKSIERIKDQFAEGFKASCEASLKLPWIDSIELNWPSDFEKRSLGYICSKYNIDTTRSHRALFDCLNLLSCLEKLDYPWWLDEEEYIKVQAVVTIEQKEDAKKHGFKWDKDKRIWVRKITPNELTEKRIFRDCPFDVVTVK